MFLNFLFFITCFLQSIFISQQKVSECVLSSCEMNSDSLKFIVLGDFGGKKDSPYVTRKQLIVAEAMNTIAGKHSAQFYISCGDNFYPRGVANVSDPRFQQTYEAVYDQYGHQKPWYLIAGNHDYMGDVSAQIAYSDISSRWNFPNYYYKFSYNIRNKFSVDFIMIDTIILCGNIFDSEDLIPPGPKDYSAAEKQWNWIEDTLKTSKASYVFLVGHYPVRSKGRQGKSVGCVQPRMEMLMDKYDVTAYLSGHDHNLQHFEYDYSNDKTFHYIVSGMAAVHDDVQIPILNNRARSMFFYPLTRDARKVLTDNTKGGFVLGSLKKKQGSFTFFNGDGEKLYSFYFNTRKFYSRRSTMLDVMSNMKTK